MSALAERYSELRTRTAPGLLAERALKDPGGIAYRAKKLGLYRERSWKDYAELVASCASGLKNLGLARGERVAIMGDACEEWVICDVAVQALGAITYGVYPTASAAELEYQMKDGGASFFIAEDQEYVDRVLPLLERLPALRRIVVIDASAMFAYDNPKLVTFAEVMETGKAGSVDALATLAKALDPAAPAFIVYTSGTTGPPKGAVVAHGHHLAGAYNLIAHYPMLEHEQRTVAYLPLCHVLGRDIAITLPLMSRLTPHFGEDAEDLPQTLFEVAPTVLFTVPRYLQKFGSQVLVAMGSSSPLKRWVFECAMRVGRRYAKGRWQGSNGLLAGLVYRVLRAVAFVPVLNRLGLDQIGLLLCGGAPLPPETMALWQIWGINLMEIYGQTETAGAIISGQRGPFPRPGDVGTVPEGWHARLAEDGEILVQSADLFEGYWNDKDATKTVLGEDGWLHTGDIGELREGEGVKALRLVDRARDFIVTAGGKTLSPSYIENALRGSPYVGEAVVLGHGRKYLTALIEIDYEAVSDWARGRNLRYAGFTSLAQHPEVVRLLQGEIERANAQLARVEQIKAFRILPKLLDPEEEGEPVTPTRKVKRKLMQERFRELVESMYDEREERLVAAGVAGVLET